MSFFLSFLPSSVGKYVILAKSIGLSFVSILSFNVLSFSTLATKPLSLKYF